MNWIFKNKNLPGEKPKSEVFCGLKNILQNKKTKATLIVLFLVCILFVPTAFAHAFLGDIFTAGIKIILMGINALVGKLFAMAATLFAVVIDPANISGANGLLNKQAVKNVWIMIRDVLNMFFILVLLFSAFCTIFQVEKWNLKKIWLSVLINALLVNFSFPIARFFIDISNVAMYYFVNNLFSSTGTVTGNTILSSFSGTTQLSGIITPDNFAGKGVDNEIALQVAMIIFTFILGMTLMICAVLFLIRLIALVMLVMFSPIGFVAFIFPETKQYADKWWKMLFQYSFFGPIMIFMMAVALQVAKEINAGNFKSFLSNASVNTPNSETTWIAQTAFFFIPIVILWMGLGMAKSMGIAGADLVVDKGKAWGKSLAASPWKGLKGMSNAFGLTGGVKKGWEDVRKSGKLFGKNVPLLKNTKEEREAKVAGLLNEGTKGWKDAVAKKRGEEFTKKYKEKSEKYDDHTGMQLAKNIEGTPVNSDNAVDVAAQVHALKSDSVKKEEFEANTRSNIVKDPTHIKEMKGMKNDQQKEAYVKEKMAERWGVINKKLQEAKRVAKGETVSSKKENPTDKAEKAKAEEEAYAENTTRNTIRAKENQRKEQERQKMPGIDPGEEFAKKMRS